VDTKFCPLAAVPSMIEGPSSRVKRVLSEVPTIHYSAFRHEICTVKDFRRPHDFSHDCPVCHAPHPGDVTVIGIRRPFSICTIRVKRRTPIAGHIDLPRAAAACLKISNIVFGNATRWILFYGLRLCGTSLV
jgi:hypothetical protein